MGRMRIPVVAEVSDSRFCSFKLSDVRLDVSEDSSGNVGGVIVVGRWGVNVGDWYLVGDVM